MSRIKIDEYAVEKLANAVEKFEDKLTSYRNDLQASQSMEYTIRELERQNQDMQSKITSAEFRTRQERAAQLDAQEANIKSLLELEFNKGYAAAYTEVTRMMGK